MIKYLFFLIIPLILIGMSQMPQDVDAQISYRGVDYLDVGYGNGTHIWIGGLPPRLDSGDGNYDIPYFKTEDVNSITVSTGTGSFVLDKNACVLTFYKGEFINDDSIAEISSDSYLMYGAILGTQNWIELTNINNAVCQTQVIEDGQNIELRGTKEVSGEGKVVFRWIKNMDEPLKIQIEVTNLNPVWTNHKVGIKQTIHVPDTIQFGDTTFFLPDFNGTIVDRIWIKDHKSEIIGITQRTNYDISLGYQYLQDVQVLYEDAQSKLVFNYFYGENQILPNETLIIDPTFGYTSGVIKAIRANKLTSTACSTDFDAFANLWRAWAHDADLFVECYKSTARWDITSIADGATITDVRIRYDIAVVGSGFDKNCDWWSIENDPTPATPLQVWNDATDGTLFVDSDTGCASESDNKILDLGTDADSDLEANLGVNWWAVSFTLDDYVRHTGHADTTSDDTPTIELQVTYALSAVYVVDLLDVYESSSTTLDSGTAICLDVDLEIASSCGTALNADSTYRFEIEVDNTSANPGSPTSFDLDAMIAVDDVLGSIPVGNLLDSGCSTNTNWAESIVSTDARATAGTTCEIPASGSVEFWMVVTLDSDANDGTGTFSITDGTVSDTSTTTTFTVNTPTTYTMTELDVYQSGTRTLDDGTAICTDVSLTSSSACAGNIVSGQTYQFQVNVTNTGELAGSPTSEEFRDVVAASDVLGSIPVTSLDTGCNDDGVDRIWTDSIVTDDAVGTAGTTCTIEANTGWEIYYWIVTIDPDATDGTGTFFVTDGTNSDVSTVTTFSLNPPPNPVTDLVANNPTFSTIELSWTEPGLNGGTLEGYQINYTTPFGDPLTIITNNTNSASTTNTVSDLTFATDYSFRVSAWTNHDNNANGNIANATTLGQTFVVGLVSVNQTNPDIIDMRFQRTEVNTTSTRVDVLYSNSYNLTCTIDHRFARTSQNYSNLDIVVFDASTSNSSFIFNDHTNDLVNMYCYNENDTTNDGRYQITWTSFPLLDQFANFRSGVYGTQGMFGVIDFITLAVVILSMIGLNRINESVGVIFNIILLGALASFGIIELPTIIFGALTVVLVFTIASTRKK